MGPQILKRLHHCLVWQLLGLQPQGTTEASAYGPVSHWGQASCHPGPLYQAASEEGPKNGQTPATLVIDCSLCYRMASGTGAQSLGPRGFLPSSNIPTPEQLIKWLPRTLFYAAATLCLVTILIIYNSYYMYIFTQLNFFPSLLLCCGSVI